MIMELSIAKVCMCVHSSQWSKLKIFAWLFTSLQEFTVHRMGAVSPRPLKLKSASLQWSIFEYSNEEVKSVT